MNTFSPLRTADLQRAEAYNHRVEEFIHEMQRSGSFAPLRQKSPPVHVSS